MWRADAALPTQTPALTASPLEGELATPKLLNVPLAEKLEIYSMPEPMSGCQLWLGALDNHGYGQLWHKGRPHKAHRLAFALARGPLAHGAKVLHKCDNTFCISPAHLRLGTQADNMTDKMLKGRAAKKLSPAQVVAIRGSDESEAVLAERYGVHRTMIGHVRNRKWWRHV